MVASLDWSVSSIRWGHANPLCIVSLLTICPEAKDRSIIAAIKMEFGRKTNGGATWRLCRMARRRRVMCGGVDLYLGKVIIHLLVIHFVRHYRTKQPPVFSSESRSSHQHHRCW